MTHIDPATADDLDRLVEQWVALVEGQREHGAHLYGQENRTVARDVLGRYITAGDLLVARADDSIQGFVMVHVETGLYAQDVNRGVIDNLYVRPADRDAGIGSRLLRAAEDHLAAQGAETVAIEVLADNSAAKRLYERRGYDTHRISLERSLQNDSDTNAPPES